MNVKPIGIRELKANLSKYLKDVKEGGAIVVTERGRAIARIVPVKPGEERSKLQSILLKLSGNDRIILPAPFKKASRPLSRKKVAGSPFSDAVREGRR